MAAICRQSAECVLESVKTGVVKLSVLFNSREALAAIIGDIVFLIRRLHRLFLRPDLCA